MGKGGGGSLEILVEELVRVVMKSPVAREILEQHKGSTKYSWYIVNVKLFTPH